MQSKAEQIRDLLETTDMTAREIADVVGCLTAYVRTVRTVRHRLAGGGLSQGDRTWRANNQEKLAAINRASSKRWYEKDPDRARESKRISYHKMKLARALEAA